MLDRPRFASARAALPLPLIGERECSLPKLLCALAGSPSPCCVPPPSADQAVIPVIAAIRLILGLVPGLSGCRPPPGRNTHWGDRRR